MSKECDRIQSEFVEMISSAIQLQESSNRLWSIAFAKLAEYKSSGAISKEEYDTCIKSIPGATVDEDGKVICQTSTVSYTSKIDEYTGDVTIECK